MAPAELMFTRLPPPWSSKCGIAAAQVFHTPMRFTSTTVRQSSRVVLSHGADRQHTGVGHRPVQPAELADAVIDRLAQLGIVADIDDTTHTATAELRHQTYRLGEVILGGQGIFDLRQRFADVDQDEVGTFLGKPQRVAASHTAGGAGDQNTFPGNASRGDAVMRLSARSTSGRAWSLTGECPPPRSVHSARGRPSRSR